MTRQQAYLAVGVIVVLYLALAAVYAVTTPIFEAPDEPAHFEYVRFIAQHHALPVEPRPNFPEHIQTAGHPPLYYFLGALLTAGVNLNDYHPWHKNPYFAYGPQSLGGNVFEHTAAEAFPFQGITLGVYVLRGFSILLGAGTILVTFWLALVLFPGRFWLALGAAGLVAFLPQFIFISSSVNSDNLVNFLSALALVQIVRLARTERTDLWAALALGVTLGLAVLAKSSALVLLPLAGIGILLVTPRRIKEIVRLGGIVYGAFLLVAGWWFLRNELVFGDPLALSWWQTAYASAMRTQPLNMDEFLRFIHSGWVSFWGNFGWGNLNMPDWVYLAFAAACLLALLGLVVRFIRRDSMPRGLLILALDVLGVMALFFWYYYSYPEGGDQGRYLFTALPAFAVLFVFGITAFVPNPRLDAVTLVPVAGLGAVAALVPLLVLAPAYKPFVPPPTFTEAQVPPHATRSHIVFNHAIGLYAFMAPPSVPRGQQVPVRLFWQPRGPISTDNDVSLKLVQADGKTLWERTRRPGRGQSPTKLWKKGTIIPDIFNLSVPLDAQSGSATLFLGVSERGGGEAWTTGDGETDVPLATVTVQ